MNCPEAQCLLHAYLDAELDMQHSQEMEQHLRVCRSCSHDYANFLALRQAIRENALYFSPPERFQKGFHRLTGTHQITSHSWRWMSAAVALLLVFFGIWGLTLWWSTASSSQQLLTREVLASHERSLMEKHLVDLSSSDQQTVKTWFQNKLDFSPPVIDLTPQGFVLLGARLDYLDGRTVAAIVYQRGAHIINLFLWPSSQTEESKPNMTALQGSYLVHWTAYGMNCWAVSDLNLTSMQHFAQLFEGQTVT